MRPPHSASLHAQTTRHRPWRWALAGAGCGLLLATLLFAPARWLADVAQQASGGQLLLLQARGSVWQGSAQLVLAGGAGSTQATALPGRVHWQLRPAWLGLQAQVLADCCTPAPLRIALRSAGGGRLALTLQDHQSLWPAALLAGLGAPWNTVQPQGQLAASTQGVTAYWAPWVPGPHGAFRLAGTLQLDALAVSSRLSTLAPIGSYRVTLVGAPVQDSHPATPATLALTTLEGSSLQLSGQGQWIGNRLRFTGEASATPQRVDALSNLLNIVGRREGARAIINLG